MNDETEKITSSHLPLDGYNTINLDDNSESDYLTRAEKIRRLKLKEEEERLKAEMAKAAREVEDMEAVLSFAARKVKANEMQQGTEIVPEERNIAIMREAIETLANGSKSRSFLNKINTDKEELDSHIRGSKR